MASAIINSQQSQIVASAEITTGNTVAIAGLNLVPRLGQSQAIKIALLVNGTLTVLVDLNFFDAAFEEFGLLGEQQKRGTQAAL